MGRRQQKKKKQVSKKATDQSAQPLACPSCEAPVREIAHFCEGCGERLQTSKVTASAASTVDDPIMDATVHAAEFDSTDSQRLAREMLSAHLDLITQTTKRARELERDFDTAAKALSRLVERPPNPERTAELEELVEKLESYADNWEDLQRSHNDSLEGLDEDFLDRFAEIELDVELPPKQQEQFDTRMNDLLSLLDRLEVQISEQGALAMRELSRAGSRFGSMAERAGAGWFFFLLFAGLGGSGGWILSRTDFSWEELLILTPVAVLGSFALSLAVRKR